MEEEATSLVFKLQVLQSSGVAGRRVSPSLVRSLTIPLVHFPSYLVTSLSGTDVHCQEWLYWVTEQ